MTTDAYGKLFLSATLALLLAGCSVGPDYQGPPDAPAVSQFQRLPSSGVGTQPAQARWWLAFHDPRLNGLIDNALRHNPDLAIAAARLKEARATLMGDEAQQYPKLNASALAARAKLPDSIGLGGDNPMNLYSSSFDASWELNLFGQERRAVQAGRAQAQASEASLADTQVSIAAEVARNYLLLCGTRERLANLNQNLQLQQKALDLVSQRRERGAANDSDVNRLQTQLENSRAEIPSLQADINDYQDQLAFLSGLTPGALDTLLAGADRLPAQPDRVNAGDPVSLLRHRPDIRSAERQLAASTATVGEHVADLYPKVTLRGLLGFSSSDSGQIYRQENESWMLIPMLQWNILDFGRVRSQINVAKAQRDEAEAQWRKTVLDALRDANSSLSRYGQQRQTLVNYLQVENTADRDSALVSQRYGAGVSSLIDLLDTQRTALTAGQNRIQAQTSLALDFVALQKSLGLGWQDGAG
ncbi:efflux transporter outer membrane subunit [Sodalis ligni]|uniref:NodT family efflux transporter outer membrane factor (OMF) lipoprotein n=1 Tax=Sodalis ligni TaxID=2697027 RepID=A0A4R1NFV3_9GAMM|nr:efflux transporter outer membrane subunit [Sodalis ligni]TCL05819.1 NodT family efflux transporter outer membrane factor (OMF) lipoprotein [Sodalis ligni]